MPEDQEQTEVKTYSAKQVAFRIGAQPRALRKFFRSSSSTVEPVGRGGRYEFPVDQLDTIRKQFQTWQKETQERLEAGKFKKKGGTPQAVEDEEEIEEFDDEEDE